MSKLANRPGVSFSLASAAVLVSAIAALGACAPAAQSQRGVSTAPAFWGSSPETVTQPTGPTFWGYSLELVAQPAGPTFWGYTAEAAARPTTGPTFWGYSGPASAATALAMPPSREPEAPVAAKR